jgi:putative pyruvate formate lyase activating enzyme
MDAGEIAGLMLELQGRSCHNINFVTPEHVAPQIVEAIAEAVPRGLSLPIVYNTSAYDGLASLRLMDGLVDIYMPDFKFWRPETALRLALARDYPERAREAIREMHRQVGPLGFGEDGLARRGVLVRHLVMPGQLDEAAAIFDWLAREVSPDTYVNVMGQFHPDYKVGETARDGRPGFAEINRAPRPRELQEAVEAARRAGLWRFDTRRALAPAT